MCLDALKEEEQEEQDAFVVGQLETGWQQRVEYPIMPRDNGSDISMNLIMMFRSARISS
jgi:hypothetical protein